MSRPTRYPLLKRWREAISRQPALEEVLEDVGKGLLVFNVAGWLFWQEIPLFNSWQKIALVVGCGLGGIALLSLSENFMEKLSIPNWFIVISAIIFCLIGLDRLLSREYDGAIVGFSLGALAVCALLIWYNSAAYRPFVPYCYGALIGPLLFYQGLAKNCLPALGFDEWEARGYVLASATGLFLALEPLAYLIAEARQDSSRVQALTSTLLMPLTPFAGMIVGFGFALLVFASALMIMFFSWLGAILSLLILGSIYYALHLR
jgi:hypothetical protein